MNKPRLKGLGRGLDALLAANHDEETDKGELQSLPTIALQPAGHAPMIPLIIWLPGGRPRRR